MTTMTAIIIDAGEANRFFPFNRYRTKSLLPLGGRALIDYTLKILIGQGFQHIILIIPPGMRGDRLRHYIEESKPPQPGNTKIEFIVQEWASGTGKAILLAEEKIKSNRNNENGFLVLYGDTLFSPQAIEGMMKSLPSSVGLLKEKVGKRMGAKMGENANGSKIITSLAFYPRWEEEISADYALAGIFKLDVSVFEYLKRDGGLFNQVPPGIPPIEEYCIENSLGSMAKEKKLYPVFLDEGAVDIDYPLHILDARDFFIKHINNFITPFIHPSCRIENSHGERVIYAGEGSCVEEGVVINGSLYIGNNTRILTGTHIQGTVAVGDNSVLGPQAFIYSALIGNNVHLGHCCELTGVIFDGVYCNHFSYISGVVGEKVNLGASTVCGTLRHDDENIAVITERGRVNTGRRGMGAFFGDYCRTGVNCSILPGRIIGYNSVADAGTVIQKNIPAGSRLKFIQQSEMVQWNPPV